MANQWRVSVSPPERSRATDDPGWTAVMRTLRSRIGGDIKIRQTPKGIFLYAPSAHAATQAEQAVRDILAEHHVSADVRRDQWHPVIKSETPHDARMNAEREQSAATGLAAWQVRVAPPSHHEAKALAARLEAQGVSVVLRWKHLIAGANCEDDAHALADQIQGYSSPGTRIRLRRGVYDLPRGMGWTPGGMPGFTR